MLAGIVTNLRGANKFYVKDARGNVKELRVGDEVSTNSTITADAQSNSQIVVELNNENLIVLNPKQGQLIDSSLNSRNFGNEEVSFNQKPVDGAVSNQNDPTDMETAAGNDPTNIETAAGEETATARSERVSARFDARDGDLVNIESDLREGTLNQDVNYYQYEQLDTSLLNPQAEPITQAPIGVITLTGSEVTEGNNITITASVDNAPLTDLIITLSNGQTITIVAGQITGSVTYPSRADDAYIQGTSTEPIFIIETTGGGYENLDYTSTITTTTVSDDKDVTTITLSTDDINVGEGEPITIIATVDNAPQNEPLVIVLNTGETIIIPVGQTTGSVVVANPYIEDNYTQGDRTLDVSIVEAAGGNYEDIDSKPVTVNIGDWDADMARMTLSATSRMINEGENITINITVDKAPAEDLLIYLDNGEIVTISAGQTSGSVTYPCSRADDFYKQGLTTETVSIIGTDGGGYPEGIIMNGGSSISIFVNDDKDTTTASIDVPELSEGEQATITVQVDNAPADGSPLRLTIQDSNGGIHQVTITYPNTKATFTFTPTDGEVSFKVIGNNGGGNYENIDTTTDKSWTKSYDIEAVADAPTLEAVIKDLNDSFDDTLLNPLEPLDPKDPLDVELLDPKDPLNPLDTLEDTLDYEGTIGSIYDNKTINLEVGDNTFSVGGEIINTEVNAGSGNDTILVGGKTAINSSLIGEIENSNINLGDGDNTLATVAGVNLSGSTVTAGSGNDIVNVDDGMTNSTISLGDGDNIFSSEGGMIAKNTIQAGSGDDQIIISGGSIGSTNNGIGGDTNIDLGDGNNTISLGGSNGNIRGDATIKTGLGNDILIANSIGIYESGKIVDINLGDGNNSVSAVGSVGSANNTNTIITGTGNDNITVGKDIKNVTLTTSTGDDTIIVGRNVSDSTIDVGDGNNIVSIVGEITSTSIEAGSGIDEIIIGGSIDNVIINVSEGENSVSIKGALSGNSQITALEGDDTIIIGEIDGSSLLTGSSISTGSGDDKISIAGTIDQGDVSSGEGNDEVIVAEGSYGMSLSIGNIYTDKGDDKVLIKGDLSQSGISTGEGDDKVVIEGTLMGSNAIILGTGNDILSLNDGFNEYALDGGVGTDTLMLKGNKGDYTISLPPYYDSIIGQWVTPPSITWEQYLEENKAGDTNIEYRIVGDGCDFLITNFENIIFEEEQYQYELSLKAGLTDNDGSETLSNITLGNLPEDAILRDTNGNELVANQDGSYTVVIDANGEAKITIGSADEISKEDLESISASVTATETSNGDSKTTQTNPVVESDAGELSTPLSTDIDLSNLTDDMIHDGIVDMKAESFDNLMITLEDVMNLGNKNITISADQFDNVTFKDTISEDGTQNKWSAVCETNLETGMSECIYTNSGDSSLQIKVEQPISDGITH